MKNIKRKLTAILSADVKGYSRLMSDDEVATFRTLEDCRTIMAGLITHFDGRVIDSPGDNLLADFSSVVDAVQCGVEIQKALQKKNSELPPHRRMEFRIGINLGDVIEEEGSIYGDGVNIAARLEGLADGGGICISGSAYDQVEGKLDLSFENLGKHTVKNISKPIRVYKVLMETRDHAAKKSGWKRLRTRLYIAGILLILAVITAGALRNHFRPDLPRIEPASIEKMAFPLPDMPSIAVLPFDNLSGDPAQEYLADGISDNIITVLSYLSDLFVIARNSTFTYKGKPVKVQQVSEELGVQYVLEGSVLKSGNKLRVNAQLVDATNGRHLWAERYDRDMKDLFDLLDEISREIGVALQVHLTEGDQARGWHQTTDNLEAWSYVARGSGLFERFLKGDNAAARNFFQQAVDADPGYAFAWTMLAWTHFVDALLDYSESREESIRQAMQFALKAQALDAQQPEIHSLWNTLYLLRGEFGKAVFEGKKAVELGPNNSLSHILYANTMLHTGNFDEAILLAEKAIRLTPYCWDWFLSILGQAYRQAGRYEDALAAFKKALDRSQRTRTNPVAAITGIIDVSMQLGHENEARTRADELLRMMPDFNLEGFRKIYCYKNPEYLERIIANLKKAGLPDAPSHEIPDKPSLAVLPFDNMSGDAEQDYFSDGLTEDLITDLSKLSGLFVISRNSTFMYKGTPVNVEQVGRELGVRYVLEGSIRKANNTVRITAQLVDTRTGGHVWAERYDRDMKDIFALQDEVTEMIVTALAVKLTEEEQDLMVRRYTDNLQAYDYALRAKNYYNRLDEEGIVLALQMLQKAVELDPTYALPHAFIGLVLMTEWSFGWTQDPETIDKAYELAEKSIELDASLPLGYKTLGMVYLWKKQYERCVSAYEKTIALAPNDADGLAGLADALNWGGRPEKAVELMRQAILLNPKFPPWYIWTLGHAWFLQEHYQKAIENFEKSLDINPNFLPSHLFLAVCYERTGQQEAAKVEANQFMKRSPYLSMNDWKKRLPYKNQDILEKIFATLENLGLD